MPADLVQAFSDLWQSSAEAPDVFRFLQSHPNAAIGDQLDLLFDMLGNATEWCQDRSLFYRQDHAWLEDGELTGKLSNSQQRVLRGGAFGNYASAVRSASRNSITISSHYDYFGFRVARTYP